MTPDRDWAVAFNNTFSTPVSAVHARIWAQVYGEEYPASLDTHSYITVSELNRIASELRLGPSDTLVDLGCGRGGPGLWVAVQSGASLIGIDIAESAVTSARSRAAAMGLSGRAEFRTGTFEETFLADASVDGVMSVDALLFTLNKRSAITELARVLKPGARLVATTWDYSSQPSGRPPQVVDHRPLLEEAGFAVLTYEETDRWRERLEAIDELLLDAVEELAAEMGTDPAEVRQDLIEMSATLASMTRRVLIVAERLDS
jgi:ubiquinone/menaquinone biosynthesis C-methylase UbiE